MKFKPFSRIDDLQHFFRSSDFIKACILGFAITIPVVIGVQIDRFEIGLALALGALLSSPSDVSGSRRHTNYGIFFSAVLAVLASLAGGYLIGESWAGVPVLGLVMFLISYLSVFGFRASLIAFSGLFALVLSFANISTLLEIYERALLIGLGGLWYLSLSYLWQRVNPKGQTEQYLSQSFELTSQYLQTRGHLLSGSGDRTGLMRKLLTLQSELNDNHETLREILISSRKASGNSNWERRRLLVFIHLVDILEVAMANPVNYDKMERLMKTHPKQLSSFRKLIFKMAERLNFLSASLHQSSDPSKVASLQPFLREVKEILQEYRSETNQTTDEDYLMLQNLYDYQEKQVQKIEQIELLLANAELRDIGIMRKKEMSRFITPQEYNPKVLIENFSLKSVIFRHSLRLAVVVMAGYAIGVYFSLQNAYWILLTLIVIMRPNYGLTKTRSRERTVGTLIGAAIAIGIVLLTHNLMLYAFLGVISLVVAFATLQKNYRTSAIFVTLSVVFIYALLEPNVLNVIQFRVVDTLIGAGLATLGNYLLWPAWESLGVRPVIAESIAANRAYLQAISQYYRHKGKVPVTYKLARKEAFLKVGNLNSAFQRMTQEPKRKQVKLDKIYEITVLNHSFLSSLASMGTFIQTHSTTAASVHFHTYTESIEKNLLEALAVLQAETLPDAVANKGQEKAENYFSTSLTSFTLTANPHGSVLKDPSSSWEELGEAQLISEQLKWLLELSTKIKKLLQKSEF